jgi:hypothetical protein
MKPTATDIAADDADEMITLAAFLSELRRVYRKDKAFRTAFNNIDFSLVDPGTVEEDIVSTLVKLDEEYFGWSQP